MLVTKYYNVAGHCFRMILPDSPVLWERLNPAYSAFEVSPVPDDTLVFSLEYVEEMTFGPRECVFDNPTEPGETVVRLYRSGTSWIFESQINSERPLCATVLADEAFHHASIKFENRKVSDTVFGINNAAMLLYAFSTASLDTLEFHASVIRQEGKAYLFLGRSGTGKSTHSSLWLKYIEGSELLNDDNPIVRVEPDGSIWAFGSPWSGKTPCYKNISAPIGAFVQIKQHPENVICPQTVLEAYVSLLSSVSGLKDGYEMGDNINASLDKLISSVPCYVLRCRPDEEAARVCFETIANKK